MIKTQFHQHKTSWKKSFLDGISQDENGNYIPWMTYPAIAFLDNYLSKDHDIFEFGCGASTLFFSQRAQSVTGLETNARWLDITQKMLEEKQVNNVEITLMEDGLDNPNYEILPQESGKKFDLIIVDSLKRFACAKNAIKALKEGGRIILDDSQRKGYRKIFEFFAENGFKIQHFEGIAPGQVKPKNTTFFWR